MATKDTIKILDQKDKENLLLRTPYALPDNPSTKGFSASQIKAKMYEGHLLTYEWIKNLQEEIGTILDKIDLGETIVKRSEIAEFAQKDLSGNTISTTYETKADSLAKKELLESEIEDIRYSQLGLDDIVDNLASNASNKVLSAKQGRVLKEIADGLSEDLETKATIEYVDQEIDAEATARDLAISELGETKVNVADVEDNLTSTSTSHPLSANQGKILKGLVDAIQEVLDSDDETLDQMSEIVAYIKNNKSLIESITTTKVNVSDIIDNLTSAVSNKPLSANQGKALKDLYDTLSSSLTTLSGSVTTHTSDTTIHITSAERTTWSGKQDKITSSNKLSTDYIVGLSTVGTTGDYNDLSNKPSIPANTSDLTNDSGFVTNSTAQIGISQVTGLESALTSKAIDTSVVHKTGSETIGGAKTFTDNAQFNGLVYLEGATPFVMSKQGKVGLRATNSSNENLGQVNISNAWYDENHYGAQMNAKNKATGKYNALRVSHNGVQYFDEDDVSHDVAYEEDIPTSVSELTNDSGYITSSAITGKEDASNKVISLSSSSTDTQYPSAKCVYTGLSGKEDASNKVTSLTSSSTDTQYPSAKCVFDEIQTVRETALGKTRTFVTSYSYTKEYLKNYRDYIGRRCKIIKPDGTDISTDVFNGLYDGKIQNERLNSQNNSIAVHSLVVLYSSFFGGYTPSDWPTTFVLIALGDIFSKTSPVRMGDVILVTEVDVPDRWVQSLASLYKMETVKVPIASISVNGTEVVPTNSEIELEIPTKTSDLTNDSGFLTTHQDISGKLDKVVTSSTNPQLYGKTFNGTQQMVDYALLGLANTIAFRGENGTLIVGEPTINSHATTKQYVDNGLASKQSSITETNKLSASFISGLSAVATSGSYSDLSGVPTIEEYGYDD